MFLCFLLNHFVAITSHKTCNNGALSLPPNAIQCSQVNNALHVAFSRHGCEWCYVRTFNIEFFVFYTINFRQYEYLCLQFYLSLLQQYILKNKQKNSTDRESTVWRKDCFCYVFSMRKQHAKVCRRKQGNFSLLLF